MSRKNDRILLIFSIITVIGLILALTPACDFDQDGGLDSLITEGVLLLPVLPLAAGHYTRLDPIPVASFAEPRIFSRTFRHPPIPA